VTDLYNVAYCLSEVTVSRSFIPHLAVTSVSPGCVQVCMTHRCTHLAGRYICVCKPFAVSIPIFCQPHVRYHTRSCKCMSGSDDPIALAMRALLAVTDVRARIKTYLASH